MKLNFFSIILVLSSFTLTAFARPSWCAGASTSVEKQICRNNTLSQYDYQITKIYRSVKSKLPGQEKKELVKTQKEWIRKRNHCRTTACIQGFYQDRIGYLANYYSNRNVSSKDISNTDDDWWSIFKSHRKTIAKKYRDLSLKTLNKMAKSDTLNEYKGDDRYSKVKQLIETMLMTEPLKFAENRYNEYKNSMPTKKPKEWKKLTKYELALDLKLSGEELELISKYNPGTLMDSMSYLNDCAYDNDCDGIATNLEVLHLDAKKKNISEKEFKIIDKLIMKFLERGCKNTLEKYTSCDNYKKNGCYGDCCSSLALIYGGIDDRGKYYTTNIKKALEISKNMCFKKNNAESCGALADIYIAKGTDFYHKAKSVYRKGCSLTNESMKKDTGNLCVLCCVNYQDLLDKGW